MRLNSYVGYEAKATTVTTTTYVVLKALSLDHEIILGRSTFWCRMR